jgi:solute carrier family 25 carnitine/acylcarnitine transporter 20/29
MRQCVREIVKTEGVFALFRGITSPMVALTILNTISFGALGETKRRICQFYGRNELVWHDFFLAGGLVGAYCSVISTPFEMLKVQLQLDNIKGRRFKGSIHCCSYLLRNYGVSGLYAGFRINSLREVIFGFFYFGLYENMKRLLVGSVGIPTLAIPTAGGIAGASAWFLSFPLDVVKSIIQSESLTKKDKNSILKIVKMRFSEFGISGFFNFFFICIICFFIIYIFVFFFIFFFFFWVFFFVFFKEKLNSTQR